MNRWAANNPERFEELLAANDGDHHEAIREGMGADNPAAESAEEKQAEAEIERAEAAGEVEDEGLADHEADRLAEASRLAQSEGVASPPQRRPEE